MAAPAAVQETPPADLVLRNGRLVTVDPARPEAQALAARGDTIVAVGAERDVARFVGPATRVIDLGGRLAIPGFIEGHGHFTSIGQARLGLDLTKARSWDDIVAQVEQAARTAGRGPTSGADGHRRSGTAAVDSGEGFYRHESLTRPRGSRKLIHRGGPPPFANARALELAAPLGGTPHRGGPILRDGGRGNGTSADAQGACGRRCRGPARAPPPRWTRRPKVVDWPRKSASQGGNRCQDAAPRWRPWTCQAPGENASAVALGSARRQREAGRKLRANGGGRGGKRLTCARSRRRRRRAGPRVLAAGALRDLRQHRSQNTPCRHQEAARLPPAG